MMNYFLISYIFILLSFMIRFQLLISNINYDFQNLNSILTDKFNICKKKIKDFILKTNNDKYIIKNNINEIEDIVNENYEDLIINIILMKYQFSNSNFKIIRNNSFIIIKHHNFSLLFSPNIINDFTNSNDIYQIYNDKSSHIIEPHYKNIIYKNDNFDNNNPDILYKINKNNDLIKFIQNHNPIKGSYIYLLLNLYDIIIDKKNKSYKTIKSSFYIKCDKNKIDFLFIFKNLNNSNFYFKNEIINDVFSYQSTSEDDIKNNKLLFTNDLKTIEIKNFYLSDLNDINYTLMSIDEFNDYYY